MRNLGIFANARVKTLAVAAGSVLKLFFAGGCAKVCRGTADIVYISFEILIPNKLLRLGKNGGMTACLNNSALVER